MNIEIPAKRTLPAMRPLLTAMAATYMALVPIAPSAAADPVWEQWQMVSGVFDLGGPRSDGSLVVAGSANLYLADPAGNVTPFARGAGGYHEDPGAEAYLAVAPGAPTSAVGCSFTRDEVFLLRLHAPLGIERVDAPGENTGSFANITGVTSLNGIAFDTTGYFDHRLLASGVSGSHAVIAAIDCLGTVQVITSTAPTLEGGLAVAPDGFGSRHRLERLSDHDRETRASHRRRHRCRKHRFRASRVHARRQGLLRRPQDAGQPASRHRQRAPAFVYRPCGGRRSGR